MNESAYNSSALRLAVLPDFAEEGWASMDLVAEMLLAELSAANVDARVVRPTYRRRLGWIPSIGRNADRLYNRFVNYPRHIRPVSSSFDCFHICDHGYSQLAHELPAGRVGVLCHDLDTFRCIIDPRRDPRPRWFRAMARRSLTGMQRAAIIFHTTTAVREEIIRYGLLDPAKLVQAPCGVAREFVPASSSVALPASVPRDFVLHVGSCIPRKRLDVLIDAMSKTRAIHLVQVGGSWTDEQQRLIRQRGISSRVVQLPRHSRVVLAELYRRAKAVVITSDAEGFGLPLVEALACGTAVIASDIPVLREVGGDAVTYRAVGDVDGFADAISTLVDCPDHSSTPSRQVRLDRAARFSWQTHARVILNAYQSLMRGTSR